MGLISLSLRDSEPSDELDDYEPGDIAIYARSDRDDHPYVRPHGGPEKAIATAIGLPTDITGDRELGQTVANKSGGLRSVDVGILISDDLGATNASKQGAVQTELAIEGTRLVRHEWNDLKLYTGDSGTVVSVVLHHHFTVSPGQSYTLRVLKNDFASAAIDTWIKREW